MPQPACREGLMRDETENARSCCVIMQVGALDETNH